MWRLFRDIGFVPMLFQDFLCDRTQFLYIFVVDLRVLEIRCRLCPIKAIVDMIRKDTGTTSGV
jgi:hypothetical protein